ncbi:SET domain-containing protein [Aaosphaeria arxii CBS 175.79]|uniref:SET domain-containing protein n=1 Tax=Aaosphaeria arxii CBS 175.79 TaxID=1450172 RepID=A0A6A5X962_9PLEO|nr:SET domain-containing protein [Aaosphaeria arxii CBS 175.79]KAF2009450.1 SET domain-containing protein [Aaosphaeria arxii CBS 175.79]
MSSIADSALHEDETLCTQILETITAASPLQILPSKISGAGIGLFVTKDVDDGEEIFGSKPLVNCVDNELQRSVCDNCCAYQLSTVHPSGRFRTAEDAELEMKACSRCKVCYYCSRACQRKAWKTHHKHECELLSETPTMHPLTRALYRILLSIKHNILSGDQRAAMQRLTSNMPELLSSDNAKLIVGASEAARSRTKTDLSFAEVVRLYCIVLTNSVSIFQPEGRMLGSSLDVVASLMNHSCDPNAFVVFEGNSLRVRSLRKLRGGEEITQCYADVNMDVLIRGRKLKDSYNFDCHCERCEKELKAHEERTPGMIPQMEQTQHDLIDRSNEAIRLINIDTLSTDAHNLASRIFPNGKWPEDLQPWPTLHISQSRVSKAQGSLVPALKYGVKGYLFQERRIGPSWIHDLLEFLQVISRMLVAPKGDIPFGKDGFPSEVQLWTILHGHLRELALGATRTFGERTAYSQAIGAWYSGSIAEEEGPKPGTTAFANRFKRAQGVLLAWAGVDESRGIVLT